MYLLTTRLSVTGLLIVLLAVWRITHLLWGEDGPFDLFLRLRKTAGQTSFGHLLDCFHCLSLWITIPFAWLTGSTWPERLILWFGISGGAILLERITAEKSPPPAQWSETSINPDSACPTKEEQPNVVLR